MTQHTANLILARSGGSAKQAAVWLDRAFRDYTLAANKAAARDKILAEAKAYGVPMSKGSFYRKFEAWKEGDILAMLPPRLRKNQALKHNDKTRLPPGFIGFWHELCIQSQRVTSAAYRSLFCDWLIAGQIIPGYSTDWRGILAAEFPEFSGETEICPFRPGQNQFHPKGWSERRLYDLAPKASTLMAARIGTATALEKYGVKIPSTRVGLGFGAVWQVDDREHDQQIAIRRNIHARGVVELGTYELATGFYYWGMKPIMETREGTRQMLQQREMHYLIAWICTLGGIRHDGSLIAGENATAKMSNTYAELVARLTGGKLTFKPGAIQNAAIAKGLPLGRAGGNPRWKAGIESIHNIFKNEMAMIPGAKGADPAHAPENLEVSREYHASISKARLGIESASPGLLAAIETVEGKTLRSLFPTWDEYNILIQRIFQRVNTRTEHNLEGWEACGHIKDEILIDGQGWVNPSTLDNLPAPVRAGWQLEIEAHPDQRHRLARMSPAEAFFMRRQKALDAGEIFLLPECHIPELLGAQLGQTLKVRSDGKMVLKDPYQLSGDAELLAEVTDENGIRHPLVTGSQIVAFPVPWDDRRVHLTSVSDAAGEVGAYLGTCPVLVRGTRAAPDAETIAAAKRYEAAMRSDWARVGQKRLDAHYNLIEENAAVFETAGKPAKPGKQPRTPFAEALQSPGKMSGEWGDTSAAADAMDALRPMRAFDEFGESFAD